jgi:hypothetical protein
MELSKQLKNLEDLGYTQPQIQRVMQAFVEREREGGPVPSMLDLARQLERGEVPKVGGRAVDGLPFKESTVASPGAAPKKVHVKLMQDYSKYVLARTRGHPRRKDAVLVMYALATYIGFGDTEAKIGKQVDLARDVDLHPAQLSQALKVLEEIGAIRRQKDGHRNRIFLNPQAAHMGNGSPRGADYFEEKSDG